MAEARNLTIHEGEATPGRADPMVSMIERVVMNPDADLDKLERMLAMKERIDAQNAKVAFAGALAEARMSIPPIVKDATVDFETAKGRTHYRHETLSGIAKAVDPILSKHGLSYRFRTSQGQGGVCVTCIVQHKDGHSEETSLSGSPDGSGSKNGFQAVGSAVTYLQRYTLKAALGLSAEVDDDGQAAGPRQNESAPRREEPPKPPEPSAHDLHSAIDCLKAADTVEALRGVWASLSKPVQAHADALQAAVARKAELTTPPADDLGGDQIPY